MLGLRVGWDWSAAADKPESKNWRRFIGGIYTSIALVSGNRRINFAAPLIDAAAQARAIFQTLLPQPMDDVQTTHAMVANYQQRTFVGLRLQLLNSGGHVSHGHQASAGDGGRLEFPRLTHIDKAKLFTGFDALLHLLGGEL